MVTLCFSRYGIKSLPQGNARLWKHNVGNHWGEKESRVNVDRVDRRRRKLRRAQLIGLYFGRTDVSFLFLSLSRKHTDLMIAGKDKHSPSCRTR